MISTIYYYSLGATKMILIGSVPRVSFACLTEATDDMFSALKEMVGFRFAIEIRSGLPTLHVLHAH